MYGTNAVYFNIALKYTPFAYRLFCLSLSLSRCKANVLRAFLPLYIHRICFREALTPT